ncbi:MAG: family 16 glycoside hydrolase [Ktedonobacteraceae bacterium]
MLISHSGRESSQPPAQQPQQDSGPAQEVAAPTTGDEPTLRASALPWYAQQQPAANPPAQPSYWETPAQSQPASGGPASQPPQTPVAPPAQSWQAQPSITTPFGSSPAQPAYGQPQQPQQSFTQPAYGQPPQQQPFSSSPSQPAYGQPQQPQPPFEIAQAQSFGAPPVQPSFEAPRPRYAQSESFGDTPAQPSPYFDRQPAPFGQPQSQIYIGTPQQPGYPGTPAQPQPFPGQLQPRPARRMSRAGMLLVALTAVVLVLGGCLTLYGVVIHPNQLHAQATSTAQAIQATQVQNTAIAQQHANATATHIAQVTATAQALANDPQALYTFATSTTPALNDPLNAQSGNGWSTNKNSDGSGCAFTGNALHVRTTASTRGADCLAQATTFNDFAYQVQMTIAKGDDGGVVFRLDNGAQKLYFFAIGSDGSYLLVASGASGQKLLAGGTSPFITKGVNQPNTLTIIARGTAIDLYVNKQFVTKADDNGSSSGLIGVFATNTQSATTDVAFTNAQVWKL